MMPIAPPEPVIGVEITTASEFAKVPSVWMLVMTTTTATATKTVTMTVVALLALPMLDAPPTTDLPDSEATSFVLVDVVSIRTFVKPTATITLTVWPKLPEQIVNSMVLAAPAKPTQIVVF